MSLQRSTQKRSLNLSKETRSGQPDLWGSLNWACTGYSNQTKEQDQMKNRENIFALLFMVLFIALACSSEPGINTAKFKKIDQAAHERRTSLAEKTSYRHFGELLQSLSEEIAALNKTGLSKKEVELLHAYSVLAEVYQDGYVLWKYKIEFAPFGIVPKGRIYVSQDVEPIAFKYNLAKESHLYEPTHQYWKSISEDSIQIIWNNADLQYKIIKGFGQ